MVKQVRKRKKINPLQHHKEALGLINMPKKPINAKQKYDRIACVFQGGGSLGAFQVGAYRAIYERGYRPNFLAGVSIGAINSAIIAGNPPEKQVERLLEFWDSITPKRWFDLLTSNSPFELVHHFHNRLGAFYSMFYGLDGFFKPRGILPCMLIMETPDKLSFYDTSELRNTLEKLVDFDRINDKKVTLCIGAVNVASGEMEFFNNQLMTITVDHVMASGALPPSFPAVKIGDDYFWDGGIYANTPLVTVLDALPELDTLCFVVDCFSLKGPLPQNMDQLEERQKDIRFASHSRRLTNVYASRQNLQGAIHFLSDKLTPEAKKDPKVQKILELGHAKRFSVVHIIYNAPHYAHSFKDYNFICSVINTRLQAGYQTTINVLKNPEWEKKSDKFGCSIYGVSSDYFKQH